jgi:hypothetical protein
MSRKWISDAVQRRSKTYAEKHAQLEREVRKPRRPSLAAKSPKQIRKFARSELYVLAGEVSP